MSVGAGSTCRGHVYHRRGEWAAFRVTGERVGTFATAREASASLGACQ